MMENIIENQKRKAIFIDGANFFHLVIKKLNIKNYDFDFEKFANYLVGEGLIQKDWKRYYVGTVREEEGNIYSKELVREQNILFGQLIKTKWEIRKNKLRTRLEKIKVDERMDSYEILKSQGIDEIIYKRKREKGIDVMIAMDILIGAFEDRYDMAILVSSDTDLMPVINYVQKNLGKRVEYVGFDIKDNRIVLEDTVPTMSLSLCCKSKKILDNEMIDKFLIK